MAVSISRNGSTIEFVDSTNPETPILRLGYKTRDDVSYWSGRTTRSDDIGFRFVDDVGRAISSKDLAQLPPELLGLIAEHQEDIEKHMTGIMADRIQNRDGLTGATDAVTKRDLEDMRSDILKGSKDESPVLSALTIRAFYRAVGDLETNTTTKPGLLWGENTTTNPQNIALDDKERVTASLKQDLALANKTLFEARMLPANELQGYLDENNLIGPARDWLNANRTALNDLIPQDLPLDARAKLEIITDLPEGNIKISDPTFTRAYNSALELSMYLAQNGRAEEFPAGAIEALSPLDPAEPYIMSYANIYNTLGMSAPASEDPGEARNQSFTLSFKTAIKQLDQSEIFGDLPNFDPEKDPFNIAEPAFIKSWEHTLNIINENGLTLENISNDSDALLSAILNNPEAPEEIKQVIASAEDPLQRIGLVITSGLLEDQHAQLVATATELSLLVQALPADLQDVMGSAVVAERQGTPQQRSRRVREPEVEPRGEITDAQLENLHSFMKALEVTPGDRDTLAKDVDDALIKFSKTLQEKSFGLINFDYTPGTGYTPEVRQKLLETLALEPVQNSLKESYPKADIQATIDSVIADLDDAKEKGFFDADRRPAGNEVKSDVKSDPEVAARRESEIEYSKPFRQAVMALELAFDNREDDSFIQKPDGFYDPYTQREVKSTVTALIKEFGDDDADIDAMTKGIILDKETVDEETRPDKDTILFLEQVLERKHDTLTKAEKELADAENKLDDRLDEFFKKHPGLADEKEELKGALISSAGKKDIFEQSEIAKRLRKEVPEEEYDTFLLAVLSMQSNIAGLYSDVDDANLDHKEVRALTSLLSMMSRGEHYNPSVIAGIHNRAEHVPDNILSLRAYEIVDNMSAGHSIPVSHLYDDKNSEQGKAILKEFSDQDNVTREEVYDYVRKTVELRFLKEIKGLDGTDLDPDKQDEFIKENAHHLKDMSQAMYDGRFIPYTFNPESAGFSGVPKDLQLMYKALDRPGLDNPLVLNRINMFRNSGSIPSVKYVLDNMTTDQIIEMTGNKDFSSLLTKERDAYLESFLKEPLENHAGNEQYERMIINYHERSMADFTYIRNGSVNDTGMDTWNGRYGPPNQDALLKIYMFENGMDFDKLYGSDWPEIFAYGDNPRPNPDVTYEEVTSRMTAAQKQTLDEGIAKLANPSMYVYIAEMYHHKTHDVRVNTYLKSRNLSEKFNPSAQTEEDQEQEQKQKAAAPGDTKKSEKGATGDKTEDRKRTTAEEQTDKQKPVSDEQRILDYKKILEQRTGIDLSDNAAIDEQFVEANAKYIDLLQQEMNLFIMGRNLSHHRKGFTYDEKTGPKRDYRGFVEIMQDKEPGIRIEKSDGKFDDGFVERAKIFTTTVENANPKEIAESLWNRIDGMGNWPTERSKLGYDVVAGPQYYKPIFEATIRDAQTYTSELNAAVKFNTDFAAKIEKVTKFNSEFSNATSGPDGKDETSKTAPDPSDTRDVDLDISPPS